MKRQYASSMYRFQKYILLMSLLSPLTALSDCLFVWVLEFSNMSILLKPYRFQHPYSPVTNY